MGVTGGILLASTYCAAEGCGATWSEPQYESVPLTVASEPQIYASPVAGGQTTMLLTTPIDHQTSIPLVDPFPTSSSNNVQILTTPLNQSNATQITGPVFARPKGIDPKIPDYDRSKYGDWKSGVQRQILERDGFMCQNEHCGEYA
jgi:hypothetical protein